MPQTIKNYWGQGAGFPLRRARPVFQDSYLFNSLHVFFYQSSPSCAL